MKNYHMERNRKVTHNQERKKKSRETNSEQAQMLDLVDEDIKATIINVFKEFREAMF